MTFEEEWEKLKEWGLAEGERIRAKYPHTKYQFDPGDAEDNEIRERDKKFYKKLAELRKKYGK